MDPPSEPPSSTLATEAPAAALKTAPPLAPSQETAYRKKCIQLKRRLQEIEANNDATRRRIEREKQHIQKMRLNRAILLNHLRLIMEAPSKKLRPEQLAEIGVLANGAGHAADLIADQGAAPRLRDGQALLDDSSDESEEEAEPSERPERRRRNNPTSTTNNNANNNNNSNNNATTTAATTTTAMTTTTNATTNKDSKDSKDNNNPPPGEPVTSTTNAAPPAVPGPAAPSSTEAAAATTAAAPAPVASSVHSSSGPPALADVTPPDGAASGGAGAGGAGAGAGAVASSPSAGRGMSSYSFHLGPGAHPSTLANDQKSPHLQHQSPVAGAAATAVPVPPATTATATSPHQSADYTATTSFSQGPQSQPQSQSSSFSQLTPALNTNPEPPVRPDPPFEQFTDHMRPQLEADNYDPAQIDARIHSEWVGLSAENRHLWEVRYREQMSEYTRLMDEYKRQQRQQGGSFSDSRNRTLSGSGAAASG